MTLPNNIRGEENFGDLPNGMTFGEKIGHRAWRVIGTVIPGRLLGYDHNRRVMVEPFHLTAFQFINFKWRLGPNEAKHIGFSTVPTMLGAVRDDDMEEDTYNPGFFAFKEYRHNIGYACRNATIHNSLDQLPIIIGTCWMWGEVITHALGYRSEFASVRSMDKIINGPELLLQHMKQKFQLT